MANLKHFSFDETTIRTLYWANQYYFVAKDVAQALGYSNTKKAVLDHCKKAELFKSNGWLRFNVPTRGMTIIPESDVYRLVFRSKLPEAERFSDWVIEEVLPSIRQTGQCLIQHAPEAANQEFPQTSPSFENRIIDLVEKALDQSQTTSTQIEIKPDLTQYIQGFREDGILMILPWSKVSEVSPVLMQQQQVRYMVDSKTIN